MSFVAWLEQGGAYVGWFAGVVVSIIAIISGCVRLYRHFMNPAREVKRISEEGDKELHCRIDGFESQKEDCLRRFQKSDDEVEKLKSEQGRQADMLAMLTDGVFLVIQHLVTDDHVEDMQEWMREYTKQTVKSDIGS